MGEIIGNLSDVRGRQEAVKPPMTDDEMAKQLENSEPVDAYQITGASQEVHKTPKLDEFGQLKEEDDKG
jgi:hypothetical protein